MSNGVDLEKGHGEAGSQAPDDLDQQPRRLGDDGGLGQVVRFALVLDVAAVHTREAAAAGEECNPSGRQRQPLRQAALLVVLFRVDRSEAIYIEGESARAGEEAVCHGPLELIRRFVVVVSLRVGGVGAVRTTGDDCLKQLGRAPLAPGGKDHELRCVNARDDPSRVEPYVLDFCLVRGGNIEVQGGPDAQDEGQDAGQEERDGPAAIGVLNISD